jgi:hypothetical protein
MTSTKYIGMDVHKESISIAVSNSVGKVVMECVIETKASMILQFIEGLRGDLHVTFEEGTAAAWLYDLLKPHVTKLVVCNPRRNAYQGGGVFPGLPRQLADTSIHLASLVFSAIRLVPECRPTWLFHAPS